MRFFLKKKEKLQSNKKDSGLKIRDLNLWDTTWVTETKTGLLVKVTIVHKFHVPGSYTKSVSKYEKDEDKIVWARHDLGNGHFQWFALYADAPVYEATEGITERDKFLTQFENYKTLRTSPDETTTGNFVNKLW